MGQDAADTPASALAVREALGRRVIVLIGMMGAGKSSIGRRLGQMLNLRFVDADTEIERAAGMTIPDIFATFGEAHFRDGEARVVARLIEDGPAVVATGGGAWMSAETRERVKEHGISVWLHAEVDVLMRRVRKRSNRPLLKTADPEGTLRALVEARYPVYAQADITIRSRDVAHDVVIAELIRALAEHLGVRRTADHKEVLVP